MHGRPGCPPGQRPLVGVGIGVPSKLLDGLRCGGSFRGIGVGAIDCAFELISVHSCGPKMSLGQRDRPLFPEPGCLRLGGFVPPRTELPPGLRLGLRFRGLEFVGAGLDIELGRRRDLRRQRLRPGYCGRERRRRPGFPCLEHVAVRQTGELGRLAFSGFEIDRARHEGDAKGHRFVGPGGVDRPQDVAQVTDPTIRLRCGRLSRGRAGVVEGVDGLYRGRHLRIGERVGRRRLEQPRLEEAAPRRHRVMRRVAQSSGLSGSGGGSGGGGEPAGLAALRKRLRGKRSDLVRSGTAARRPGGAGRFRAAAPRRLASGRGSGGGLAARLPCGALRTGRLGSFHGTDVVGPASPAQGLELLGRSQRPRHRVRFGRSRRPVLQGLEDSSRGNAFGIDAQGAVGEGPGQPFIAPFHRDACQTGNRDRVRRVQLDELPVGLLGLVERTVGQRLVGLEQQLEHQPVLRVDFMRWDSLPTGDQLSAVAPGPAGSCGR